MERKLYVLLTDTGTLLTRVIKMVTRDPLNHASIAFDLELNEVYSFGRKKPSNPFIGGFVKEDLDCKLFSNASCALYCCTVSDEAYEQIRGHIELIEQNRELYKYNLIGLFCVLFNMKLDRKNAYFCSQFVASLFEESGVVIAEKPSALFTPGDFTELSAFKLVYQGPLNQYLYPLNLKRMKTVRTA